jgi:serine/threonine protein kinase
MFNYRYKVMRLLGKGAFGSVYLVHDQIIGPESVKIVFLLIVFFFLFHVRPRLDMDTN